jgi:N-acetyl sugar amidotransferase
VLDTTDSGIVFDENGVCSNCRQYDELAKKTFLSGGERERRLESLISRIKQEGENKEHDCLIGMSGGVDSSYLAYLTKKFGLRPLAFHLDNGWDSELAVDNIERILNKLGIPLYTHVIDWEEFKDLQLAYLRASVVDIEVASDHAITAGLYDLANRKGINYILSGSNVTTEGGMPSSWAYRKNDLSNLESIHHKWGAVKLKTYPKLGLFKLLYCGFIKGINSVNLLDYVDYNKIQAKKLLQDEFGWKDYGGKHYESLFTKFYQAYILPTKFNIDKRRGHLSSLIRSGQISRVEALKELEKPLYPKEELERDKEYVLKKFGLSEKEFEGIMGAPIKRHQDYATDEWAYIPLRSLRDLYKLVSERGFRK